jgi:hypothetical protein
MTRGALVGLAAIVAMVTEPWWSRALQYRPQARRERQRLRWMQQHLDRPGPLRGEITRPGRDLERRRP